MNGRVLSAAVSIGVVFALLFPGEALAAKSRSGNNERGASGESSTHRTHHRQRGERNPSSTPSPVLNEIDGRVDDKADDAGKLQKRILFDDDPGAGAPVTFPVQVGLEASLENCNVQNFPFVFVTLGVQEDGVPQVALPEEAFEAFENGLLQTDFFKVIPPGTGGGNTRQADVVILVDTSGSMGPIIDTVKLNVSALADALAASDVNFALGLVKFGNLDAEPNPFVFNGGSLTSDVDLFQGQVDTLMPTGGFEPGFLAIREALQTFQFRTGSQVVFVLISDEDSDDLDKLTTLNQLLANNVQVHVAVDCFFGDSNAQYCVDCDPDTDLSACSVRGATGGLQFGLQGSLVEVIDAIPFLFDTYIVRYRSDNPFFDSTERLVETAVTSNLMTDSVACIYTPGSGSTAAVTEESKDLSDMGQVEGDPLPIVALVTDDAEPFTQSVDLFYKPTGLDVPYQQTPMLPVALEGSFLVSDLYAAEIPGSIVQNPGVDYYVRATDGLTTSFDPSNEPSKFPYQIAVLPNQPPLIVHTPVTGSAPAVDVGISAGITDTTNQLVAAMLNWRPAGTFVYNSVSMLGVADDQFEASIPAVDVTTDGIDYFLSATDDLGVTAQFGSPDTPLQIVVTDDEDEDEDDDGDETDDEHGDETDDEYDN